MSIDGKTRPPDIPPEKWAEHFDRIFKKPPPKKDGLASPPPKK